MARDLTPIAERFNAIASRVLSADELPADPFLHRYCGSNADPAKALKYVRHQTDMLDLARVDSQGAVVVDAGCGFGFAMIVQALLGARLVRGLEVHKPMVETAIAYLPLIPPDVSSRLEISEGSVAEMPYDDDSADIILSIEAISHYLDVDAFIEEARRILRPGGVLIVVDGNNATNPLLKRRTVDLWEAFELGPEGREVDGHVIGVPYVELRRRLVEARFPDLPGSVRDEIATSTAGFAEAQVIEAANEYVASGTLPSSPYRRGQLAIDPDGRATERLFSPHGLARDLGARGFSAQAYGYWGGADGNPLVRFANDVLTSASRVTMPTCRSFRVIARKQQRSRAR
jgi:SAM-dependent methyltransferase